MARIISKKIVDTLERVLSNLIILTYCDPISNKELPNRFVSRNLFSLPSRTYSLRPTEQAYVVHKLMLFGPAFDQTELIPFLEDEISNFVIDNMRNNTTQEYSNELVRLGNLTLQ